MRIFPAFGLVPVENAGDFAEQHADILTTLRHLDTQTPFHGKGKLVLAFLVLLAIIIGLSVGLTKDEGGEPDVLFPDPNDPPPVVEAPTGPALEMVRWEVPSCTET